MNTGDRQTVADVYPAVQRYLALYKEGENGLNLFHHGNWDWGDWGDNRDMLLLQNCWFCMAAEAAADMAELLGFTEDAAGYRARTENLKEAIRRETRTGTCDRDPAYTGATDDRVQALAVLAGIATPDQYEALYEVFRTEEHASPYMEKYVMEALFCIGHGDYALERTRKRFDFIVNHPDFDTLFEGWDVGVNGDWDCGSVNHAWSGGTLAVLPTRMFGLRPTEAGWKRFCFEPDPNLFDRCSLSFPTVSGTVKAEARNKSGRIVLKLSVPEGTVADVSLPWAFRKGRVDGKSLSGAAFSLGKGRHTIRLKQQ